jgi:hypothetical protein
MEEELRIGTDVEANGRGLFQGIIQVFAWGLRKIQHLSNTNLEYCFYPSFPGHIILWHVDRLPLLGNGNEIITYSKQTKIYPPCLSVWKKTIPTERPPQVSEF